MDKITDYWYNLDMEKVKEYKHLIMLDLEKNDLEKMSNGDDLVKEYENKDYEEIAEILGMQPPAVRMQMSRARKEIRACYLKQMER